MFKGKRQELVTKEVSLPSYLITYTKSSKSEKVYAELYKKVKDVKGQRYLELVILNPAQESNDFLMSFYPQAREVV